MKKLSALLFAMAIMTTLSACTTETKVISRAESSEYVTATLSDNDFENAAKEMIDDMLMYELATPKSNGQPYVMMISDIKNDTMQRINTADLTDYIKKELRRSGKVKTTNAFGDNRSENIALSRQLGDSALVDKSTVKKNNTVKAFDLTLEGRIAQKNSNVGNKKMIEYIFSLNLIDMGDGTELWSDKKVITKITDKNTKTW
ncbi:MAG: penicillin-binding protein activator LpoB [Alphaproteobacteria bacterium]|nr:penicillin-binding protein activator LpoB [Alphaproteobacteria bacterium]